MPNRNIAPRITPLSTPTLLPYQCLILANGTEIFYLNDPLQEVFKIDVVFEAGIYYQSQPLVASTTVNMLNEGTLHHSAEAIADQFDYYGAYVDFRQTLHGRHCQKCFPFAVYWDYLVW